MEKESLMKENKESEQESTVESHFKQFEAISKGK
jgi:hypothetical protein